MARSEWLKGGPQSGRAFAVKIVPKRLPVFPFSGLLKDSQGHRKHRFENGGTNQIRQLVVYISNNKG